MLLALRLINKKVKLDSRNQHQLQEKDMEDYDYYYWHAVDNLLMPPKDAHEWAEQQTKEEQPA